MKRKDGTEWEAKPKTEKVEKENYELEKLDEGQEREKMVTECMCGVQGPELTGGG